AWANAELAGDARSAAEHLGRAQVMAAALEQRPRGDATLGDAVRAIHSAAGRERRRLAHAHASYAAGCELDTQLEWKRASVRFQAAADSATGSPALRGWARMRFASMQFHGGDARLGEAVFRQVAAWADTVRYPALAAHVRILLGARLVRSD